jgi:hypothetical protein
MIIGVIKAIAIGVGTGIVKELDLLLLTIGLFFGVILMFSQLFPRQRGLTIGATMIFLGSLLGVVAGAGRDIPPFLFTLGISFLISMFWMRLSNGFMRLFFEKGLAPESLNRASLQSMLKSSDTSQTLHPQIPSYAVIKLNPDEQKPAEPAQPFSITEDSTSLLNKK